jgi:hypothetical protein
VAPAPSPSRNQATSLPGRRGSQGRGSLLAEFDQVVGALVVPNSGPSRGTNAKELSSCSTLLRCSRRRNGGDPVWDGSVHGPWSIVHRATRPLHLCTSRKPQGTSAVPIALIRYTAAPLHCCTAPSQSRSEHPACPGYADAWEVGSGLWEVVNAGWCGNRARVPVGSRPGVRGSSPTQIQLQRASRRDL